MFLQAQTAASAVLCYEQHHICPWRVLLSVLTKLAASPHHPLSSYLLFFCFLYFSYSPPYFCPHLQPRLLLVPMSHRLPNLSNPPSLLRSASWPRTAPPWGGNRCSDTHSTEHTATCGIGPGTRPTVSKCAGTHSVMFVPDLKKKTKTHTHTWKQSRLRSSTQWNKTHCSCKPAAINLCK